MANSFLDRIRAIIEENLSDERFGVSELADAAGMSRSNLLRKIKESTKLSVSQLIREIRLQHAMEMLKDSSLTVSEVSFKVGFSSSSYFVKCFHDHFGYPPGEAGARGVKEDDSDKIDLSHGHQLAAIMFTDIEGYTALMQKDEVKAIDYRNRHREVFNTVTKKYHGKILQYYGDGTLSTFSSAIDAVRCGIEMQLEFRRDPQIPVRVGIHTGDIIASKDDIIGDGVNVASRIESLAAIGSVFISEKVYDEVKNQSGIYTVSMGVFELKNVDKPMEVFAITNPGLTVPEGGQVTGKTKNGSGNGKKSVQKSSWSGVLWVLIIMAAVLFSYVLYSTNFFGIGGELNTSRDNEIAKKSIAVLPFINDSMDSSNVYIINGLMESTLNNLQKIKDLRVISRTSVESYRNNPKAIPDIARELNVKYIVEGSGQKTGDQILLNIQLIEAQSDTHLWSEQYVREAKDIFDLQIEIAKKITNQIEVIITPEEEKRIEKIPTDNLVAYDHFLKGMEVLNSGVRENFMEAIGYFQKAVQEDPEFARAYAGIAMAYYYIDQYQSQKHYTEEINNFADRALLYESELAQSLIAKALFYMNSQEYESAESYFEKALEYNPNFSLVYIFLVDLYVNYIPNTEKYLEYGLKGLEIDIGSYDSITTSFIYLHISNAFMQSGFVDEAEKYINKSLKIHPENLYSEYTKAYVLYGKNEDLQQIKDLVLTAFKKDTTRLDIMQEVGKLYYYLREYDSAYQYYRRFAELREAWNLDLYRSENAKIAVVFSKMRQSKESEKYFIEYLNDAKNDQSIYKDLSLTAYYSYKGDTNKALEHFRLFSQQDNYHYWTLLFTPIDPLLENIKDLPEFNDIMSDLETKFWNNHKRFRAELEEKGLI
jgi:TolB-like protein/class 3 adenylate cyclase/Tfp pilus assembly protein PilF